MAVVLLVVLTLGVAYAVVDLRELWQVLEDLNAQRDAAFDRLAMPPEEDAS